MLMTKAVQEGRLDIVEYLISNGMIPDKTKALLHEAVKNDDLAMVRCLGSYYGLSEHDINGDTPLHLVRSIPVAEWLVMHGAKADDKNNHEKYPYEVMPEGELRDWLEHKYRTLHPRIEEETFETALIEVPWESRFITRTVSVEEFKPVSIGESSKFFLEYEGVTFSPTHRFLESFARKMKISSNIFSLFSAEEVFDRIQERMPYITLKATFDIQENKLLGVVDEKKKFLPPDQAIEVILQDNRLKEIEYHEGIWQARFEMNEKFEIANDSPYVPTFWLDYPVDGLANASIYLGVLRLICSNGAKAISRGFRTEIEVSDNYGTHLAKLLASYSNDIGVNSLRYRLEEAQRTKASVNELQQVGSLLTSNVNDKTKLRALLTRLEDLAGDPCFIYQVTSLKNIGPKKAKLLPVECSVNDLFIFCSELITHHRTLITSTDAFNSLLGNMLSQEFDLEDMYPIRKPAPAFTLKDMEALCV